MELLDAAHILPDRHPKGEPIVTNGLGLCTIHHSAYDANIIGIDPDTPIRDNLGRPTKIAEGGKVLKGVV